MLIKKPICPACKGYMRPREIFYREKKKNGKKEPWINGLLCETCGHIEITPEMPAKELNE